MNVSRIKIQGFKCFLDSTIELKNLTVLCGSNGSGKSSVIQAILLARLSIEKNSPLIGDSYNLDRWNNVPVPLNGFYELNLGEREEIENGHQFKIDIDGLSFLMKERDSIGLNLREDNILVDCSGAVPDNAFITRREFYYLNAERIGPRYISEFVPMDFPNCGFKGEKTGQVYYDFDKSFYKVESSRCFPGKKGAFRMQADAWIDYICPGITPTVEYIGRLSGQIRLRNNMINKLSAATNIGFGVSYLLPIVVTGLIAEPNTLFIVENPEAHLHPKAQSNLGFYLGVIAASGVRILIETHSEHIINGIRRAVLSKETNLDSQDIGIYFFNGYSQQFDIDSQYSIPNLILDEIDIDDSGNLSNWPVDFFDQTRQDLADIIYMSRKS